MKRAESQLKAFIQMFESDIRTELVSEDLFVVEADESAVQVAEDLRHRGFDECGVRRNGWVREIIHVDRLTGGNVGDHAAPVSLERLAAPSTPLWSCLPHLVASGPLFLLGNNGIDGIVTVADLDKQPARLLMFGLVSMLEMAMVSFIRAEYSDESWCKHLADPRIVAANELLAKRRDLGREIDLLECLQIADKATICSKTKEIRDIFGISKGKLKKLFERLENVRNNLAHAQSPIEGSSWKEAVEDLRAGHQIFDKAAEVLRAGDRENRLAMRAG